MSCRNRLLCHNAQFCGVFAQYDNRAHKTFKQFVKSHKTLY